MNIVLFLEIKVHIKIINIPTNRNIYNKFGAVQIRVMPSSLGPFFVDHRRQQTFSALEGENKLHIIISIPSIPWTAGQLALLAHRKKKPPRALFLLLGFSVWRLHVLPVSAWVLSKYFFPQSKDIQPVTLHWQKDGEMSIPANITFIEEKASEFKIPLKMWWFPLLIWM